MHCLPCPSIIEQDDVITEQDDVITEQDDVITEQDDVIVGKILKCIHSCLLKNKFYPQLSMWKYISDALLSEKGHL